MVPRLDLIEGCAEIDDMYLPGTISFLRVAHDGSRVLSSLASSCFIKWQPLILAPFPRHTSGSKGRGP
jgi:hypothetical protein